jgi:hypothetical protein
MPSFVHLTLGFGGTALVVGIMAQWLHEPQQPSSLLSATSLSSPRSRIVGNSALSHGGPLSNTSMAMGVPLAQFKIGQKLIVAAADNVSHTIILLPLPQSSTTSSSIVGERRIVLPGTMVFVNGMQSIEPAPGYTEQYYEVTIPDGGKGWLSERVLRPTMNGH